MVVLEARVRQGGRAVRAEPRGDGSALVRVPVSKHHRVGHNFARDRAQEVRRGFVVNDALLGKRERENEEREIER